MQAPALPLQRLLYPYFPSHPSFLSALEGLISKVSTGRFSKKEGGVPEFSGYFQKKSDNTVLIWVIQPIYLREPKGDLDKKVKQAWLFQIEHNECVRADIVFKRIKTKHTWRISDFKECCKSHDAFAIEFPQSVACSPKILGQKRKGSFYVVEWWEKRYLTTLDHVKVGQLYQVGDKMHPFPIDLFTAGLQEIAKHLAALHQRGFCHLDVKSDNIFIDFQNSFKLLLSDYDLLNYVGSRTKPKDYCFWDLVREKRGYATSFTDIYGWTMVLGEGLIPRFYHFIHKRDVAGRDLATHLMNHFITHQILDEEEEEVEKDQEVLLQMDSDGPNPYLNLMVSVYQFCHRVATLDIKRLEASSAKDFDQRPQEYLKELEISPVEFLRFASDIHELAKKIKGASGTT